MRRQMRSRRARDGCGWWRQVVWWRGRKQANEGHCLRIVSLVRCGDWLVELSNAVLKLG